MATSVQPFSNGITPAVYKRADENQMSGLNFVIDKTWDGEPVDHQPFRVHLEWVFQRQRGKPHKRAVKVTMEGPLFDDPPPADELGGFCPELYNYECFEIFFANNRDQYLEVEIGPHGHFLVLLLNGRRQPFNDGSELDLQIENVFVGADVWRSTFEIPLAYFPPNLSKFNAYALHGLGPERKYDALFPVTDGTYDEPDFHRLEFFQPLDVRKIIPETYNETSFNDLHYGDLWKNVC
uniref:Uncharacterized protein n=1 Tax=Romanomermis culicivorax TaxID=13658 RepID=A0A915K3M9_ROMCU